MKKLIIIVRKNTWSSNLFTHGWGNGYILIPPGHSLYGISYIDLNNKEIMSITVHGGLTFSRMVDKELINDFFADSCPEISKYKGYWIVGFDTAHYGDNIIEWTEQRVRAETETLKNQLMAVSADWKEQIALKKFLLFDSI